MVRKALISSRRVSAVSDQAVNALLAIGFGTIVAILLLAPTAAVQYRRDGRLGPMDLLVLVSAAVYGLALWTYTLIPMPADNNFTCQPRQLEVFGSFRPVIERGLVAPALLIRDTAFLQLALNVLLFVPLGFFVRWILGRGVVVTTLMGFFISLAIETTQLTGVWGLYRCAYRLFDVDDLIVNTMGAFIGGVLASLVVRRRKQTAVDLPDKVTLGRRWIGFVSDAIFIVVTGAVAVIAWRAWSLYVAAVPLEEIDQTVSIGLQILAPLIPQSLLVLVTGRTVGEWAVDVRSVPRGKGVLARRTTKLAAGVGGYSVLLPLTFPGSGALLTTFVVATLALSIRTEEHRGLSHWVSGLDLRIDR